VEFNSSLNPPAGNHVLALSDSKIAKDYGLAPEDEGKIWGEGDQRILDAMSVLRELQKEGKIKRIGFSGTHTPSRRYLALNDPSAYPLPTLLRLALLVRYHAKEPVDIIQTYSHQNLQNTGLSAYLSEFRTRAGVQTVMNASPLNMGLLTTSGPPAWHPASPELRQCVDEAKQLVQDSGVTVASRPVKIEDVAVSFGMRDVGDGPTPPVVVGCSTLDQVSWLV
jgi:D-arabinose 1-dehydrogenase